MSSPVIAMFRYDWSLFEVKLGLIFAFGVLVVSSLTGPLEFSVMAAGLSALLAWCTIILAPRRSRRQHLVGLLIYLIVGAALTGLAAVMAPYPWAIFVTMGVVTFAGYMVLLFGLHPFMVAWCLVYWYLLVPLYLGDKGLNPVLLGHVIGAGLVIGLNLWKPVWSRATRKLMPEPELDGEPSDDKPAAGLVVCYASVVSLGVFSGLALGTRWLTSDPTLVANATLNMISPSLQQTWVSAVERIVCGSLGIIGGFYCGWFFADPWVGNLVTVVCSFLALGVLYINLSLLVGILFFMVAYPWGLLHSDLGHLMANEKLAGEWIGVAIAIVAIAILNRLLRGSTSTKN